MADRHNERRVAVTGMGMVSAVGHDVASNWDALLAGTPGGGPITAFDPAGFATRIACEVKGFDSGRYLTRKESRRYDRFCHFAMASAVQAMESAGLEGPPAGSDPTEFGVIMASGVGGIATLEANCSILNDRGPGRVSPFFIPMFIPDIAAGLISIRYGLQGPNYATVSACASGSHAIGDAVRYIQRGEAKLMLAGGAEAAVTPITIAGFSSMKAMSRRNDDPEGASRPFDAGRDGFVIGEGAGCVLLEELEHARARGAEIFGEVVGYGATGDAHHITAPPPDAHGAQSAMRLALEDGGVRPEDVDYINAHGTSTPQNDTAETAAVKAVLGGQAYNVVMGSTKSMTGHLLGAAGAVETVICVMACRTGRIPPTINFSEPDDTCDLDYAHHGMVERPVSVALNNSFGFGGHNVCLAIRRYEG
ncbi:MAG: beta-ketoacyl-ACP synthase II [Gemmatimonadetes bacterium]|nr:beta-ketoacyl-ACP synthase II [Gemmatimonadota bacterium]MCY3678792.1 beta-ketoacyl-ACP synthase II [Gemmatimonadota bacterium]MYA42345.1 beta-ketoacyl-ACP synthase II [Gemmatimonadota bacterium]MYE92119.1 beta-ketoacyl-ACP synthase II [Gemmatimonadota bacterium]MYJ11368.1 beta-ketoacyl-ACP synthase II [Gemmatimonadota bacterium]